jgi:Cu/Ag efflux pump CusA
MVNQPDLVLRYTRSALIGMTALAYSTFISLVVMLFLSEPVNAEMAIFTVGVLGFALGLTVALVVVSQAFEQACKRTLHG